MYKKKSSTILKSIRYVVRGFQSFLMRYNYSQKGFELGVTKFEAGSCRPGIKNWSSKDWLQCRIDLDLQIWQFITLQPLYLWKLMATFWKALNSHNDIYDAQLHGTTFKVYRVLHIYWTIFNVSPFLSQLTQEKFMHLFRKP